MKYTITYTIEGSIDVEVEAASEEEAEEKGEIALKNFSAEDIAESLNYSVETVEEIAEEEL